MKKKFQKFKSFWNFSPLKFRSCWMFGTFLNGWCVRLCETLGIWREREANRHTHKYSTVDFPAAGTHNPFLIHFVANKYVYCWWWCCGGVQDFHTKSISIHKCVEFILTKCILCINSTCLKWFGCFLLGDFLIHIRRQLSRQTPFRSFNWLYIKWMIIL